MGREDFVPKYNSLLCSRHFREEDFERTSPRKILKPNVVPSVFESNQNKVRNKRRPNKKSEKKKTESL